MQAEYTASLTRVAAAEAEAANPGSKAAAAAAAQEFMAWLSARSTARGVDLLTCTPEDIIVFLESYWLRRHGSLLLSDGNLHAAPSTLSATISHLSGVLKAAGRSGLYDPDRQAGNACLSADVAAFKTTYTRRTWQLGYAEKSAKSLAFSSYDQLMQQLHIESSSLLEQLAALSHTPTAARLEAAMPALTLLRDCVLISMQWDSAVRGRNACILRGQDVQDRRGGPLLPQLQRHSSFLSPLALNGSLPQMAPSPASKPGPAGWS